VDLELLSEGKAKITQSCVLEDGSHGDVHEVVQVDRSVTKGKVKVAYPGVEDLLDYHESLSYADFAETGSGPGLKQIPPIHKDIGFTAMVTCGSALCDSDLRPNDQL